MKTFLDQIWNLTEEANNLRISSNSTDEHIQIYSNGKWNLSTKIWPRPKEQSLLGNVITRFTFQENTFMIQKESALLMENKTRNRIKADFSKEIVLDIFGDSMVIEKNFYKHDDGQRWELKKISGTDSGYLIFNFKSKKAGMDKP